MDMTDLPPNEWKVLLALAHHRNAYSGLCNPNNQTIARFAHMDDSHISRVLKSLKDLKLIDWASGKGKGRGVKANNRYTLNLGTARGGKKTLIPLEAGPESILDEPLIPPYEVETCNQQSQVGREALDLPPRSGQRSVPSGTVQYSNRLPDDEESQRFAETRETLDPKPPTPTLPVEDLPTLSNLYAALSGNEDLPDHLEEFAGYGGSLPAPVIANALWWAYRLSNYWKTALQPTAGDFLRALPAIHRQYENFYKSGKKKPHEQWNTVLAVFHKVVPPAPDPIVWNLEGKVSVEDQVELPKSKAFQIED